MMWSSHMYAQVLCSLLVATIQVSDQPVAPSFGRTASTLALSAWARFTMICQVVPSTESPFLKAWISFV